MINVRKAEERGHANHGWLHTYHTFSFADYYDPNYTQFRALRVMNEDRVQPGQGFGTHGHRDMEILSYVLEGALEHRDSLGNGSVICPGELQYMSAGTGVRHSEFNASDREVVHFYQIWLVPDQRGLAPRYAQQSFPAEERAGRLQLVAAPEPAAGGAIGIRQDARVYLADLDPNDSVAHPLPPERHAWLQVLRGGVTLNGLALNSGDGAQVSGESLLRIAAAESAGIMLFDLA